MPRQTLVVAVQEDEGIATWLQKELAQAGYNAVIRLIGIRKGPKWAKEVEQVTRTALAVVVLISPESVLSDQMMQPVTVARQYERAVFPILTRNINSTPWYIEGLPLDDFTTDLDSAFRDLTRRLPPAHTTMTFGEARDIYTQRASLKSPHTTAAYRRAVDLFLEFLGDRSTSRFLPIQQKTYLLTEEIPISALTADDAPLFLHFAEWMLAPTNETRDRTPYRPATIELRLAGVQNWFQFLDDHGWLPPQFQLSKAKRIANTELRGRSSRIGPPRPPDDIEEVIYYYDTLQMPKALQQPDTDNADRIRRWELTRLRNRALLHTLAETGGRISEILSLNLTDFPERYLNRDEVLRVEVTGKGGHKYYLRFMDALPALRAYIHQRGSDLRASPSGITPLFASHDIRYDGQRMSRVVAWRVVQRAARALGLPHITPHDFRHWRATQLINAGHSLDVVQDYLGHRSVETTRSYYAHTDPLRVDDVARKTGLPHPENDP
jgi:site-specific recombinase XerD